MNGYKAFYKGKNIEVYANSKYEAQQIASKQFKAKKSYDVSVMLCEKNCTPEHPGEQVIHTPSF